MNEYVIIGNSIAAVGCVEGIRKYDKEGKITIVSKENHKVYARPLISYYLEKKTDLQRINYRSGSFYEDEKVELLLGESAAKIDTASKKVLTDSGKEIPYTKVCVATGSSPFVPPMEGLENVEKKFSFMTIDDSLELEKTIDKTSRVLIVGAGLIGLKCAEGIKDLAGSITVCDLADRVLSSILDAECAAFVQKGLEANGIEFFLSDSVAKFEANKAYMKSGKEVDFDVLVLAIGVRANISLIKDIGGETNRGIVINEKSETSIPDVYAAGDCAEGFDSSIGAKRVLALLPNAYMQGHAAGVNMAGGEEVFDKAIPMNSIGFFGTHIMTAGTYEGEMIEEKDDVTLKRFFVKDNKLVGYMLINDVGRAGIYTSLIREKVSLDTVDFELLKKVATTFAFSKENRGKKFGGVV